MKMKDILGAVGSVAPAIATALGGPLAGTAAGALSNALFGTPDKTEQEVAEVIAKATPEDLLKIKLADQQFEKDMKALDIDLTKAYIADTSDARHVFGSDMKVFWLGMAILLTFAGTAFEVLSGNVPVTVSEVLTGTVVGYLAANAQQVVGYFFGSSQGSADKTAAMTKAVTEQSNRKQ